MKDKYKPVEPFVYVPAVILPGKVAVPIRELEEKAARKEQKNASN